MAKRDLKPAGQYLQGGHEEDGVKLFTALPSWRKRQSGHVLMQERLQLGIRSFFPMRTVNQWNRLPER